MAAITICRDFGAPPKYLTLFLLFLHLFAMKWWDWMPWSLFFECWVLSQLFYSSLSLSSRGSLILLHFLPFSTVQFSHSVTSDSLWPHRLQHTRLPCPSPTPGVCSRKFMFIESVIAIYWEWSSINKSTRVIHSPKRPWLFVPRTALAGWWRPDSSPAHSC